MSLYIDSQGRDGAPTIVFLHGMGVSSWMWNEQITALAGAYHTLAIDLPGNGESYQTPWLSLADSAAQVAAVIAERATDGRAHVVGLSLGGYVALKLLDRHPERVESVIVSGVTARPLPNAGLLRWVGGLQSMMARWPGVPLLQARMLSMPNEIIPLMARDLRRMSATTVARVYDEVLGFSLPAHVHSPVQRRLLAVAGEAEVRAIVQSLPDFLKLTPAGMVQACFAPKVHHAWPGERPDLFTAMVRAWVSAAPLPAELLPAEA